MANEKKYASLESLQIFKENIDEKFATKTSVDTLSTNVSKKLDASKYVVDDELSSTSTNPVQNNVLDAKFEAISTAMNALESEIDGKAASSHTHDDRYYTETEVDTAIANSKNTWYGTCPTAANTAAKVVTTNTGDFSLTTGNIVYVLFTYAAYSNSTLNVDGTGAIAIKTAGTTGVVTYQWAANEAIGFVYDGTYFRMLDGMVANTTYYGMTKLSSSTSSTSTTMAATPSAVKAAYDLANTANTAVSSHNHTSIGESGTARTLMGSAQRPTYVIGANGTTSNLVLLSDLNRTNSVATANTNYSTYMARGIAAGTTDLTAGSSSLTNGCIYLVYE